MSHFKLLTGKTLHLGQSSLLHLLLASMIPFSWSKRWPGRHHIDSKSFVFFSLSMLQFLLIFFIVEDVLGSSQAHPSSIHVHGVRVSLRGVHLLSWSEGVVQAWGCPLHLFSSVLEVDVFPLTLDGRLFPLIVRPQLIQLHAVSI